MISPVRDRPASDPLDLLRECGAYYECPKDAAGRRLGPLVGYAGRDGRGRQYVGDIYLNFARAERHPHVLAIFARQLVARLTETRPELLAESRGFCGAPEGGKAFAYQLALETGRDYIYPEKAITAVATRGSREASELVFGRHEPEAGQSWFIVEDVCNNFSTTAKLVALVEHHRAHVAAVLCFLNRSETVDAVYEPTPGLTVPVIALVRKPFGQYSQDDPAVAEDLARGNVAWSPKRDWARLAEAMSAGAA